MTCCCSSSARLVLLAIWLLAGRARAQEPPVVLWLGAGGERDVSLQQAVQLELQARGPWQLGSAPLPAGPPLAPDTPWQRAVDALAGGQALAVLWLEPEPARAVTWLRVLERGRDQPAQAPLPYPPEQLAPQLVAIAAASLLDQQLNEPAALTPPPAVLTAPTAVPAAPLAPRAPAQAVRVPAAERSDRARRTEPSRVFGPEWFVQIGGTYALAFVSSGLEADRDPSAGELFAMDELFDDSSAWVPDGDSRDALGPVPGNCEADGIATQAPELPSKYCVRVEQPGMVAVPALRLALGRWFLPELALALLYQWHFGVDSDGFFDHQQLGLQTELLVAGERARGLALSVLAGATAGRTDTPVEPRDPAREHPNALTGPFGAHAGTQLRYAASTRLGLAFGPALGLRFPVLQLTLELFATAEARY